MRRIVLLFFCLVVVGCTTHTPHPCRSPPLMTGSMIMAVPNDFTLHVKYTYDAVFEQVHLRETVTQGNKTSQADLLLLYQEGVVYTIDHRMKSCSKERWPVEFHPLAIPQNASFLGQAVLGSSSGRYMGLRVNTWTGELETKAMGKFKYMTTVTEFGCIPVSTVVHTEENVWAVYSFFNNVRGIVDPQVFIPPPFCEDAQLQDDHGLGPADVYSLFHK